MTDVNYCVIRQDDNSFAVKVTRTDALPQTVAGFTTEAEADAWIVQDRRLRDAADPFRTPVYRRRHGF